MNETTTAGATADRDLITAAVHDYFEGWWDGDVTRMARALHPALVKRTPRRDLSAVTTTPRMLELTGDGEGAADAADRQLDVAVTDVHDDIACVVVRSAVYREYLHLVRTDDGWRITNALWQLT